MDRHICNRKRLDGNRNSFEYSFVPAGKKSNAIKQSSIMVQSKQKCNFIPHIMNLKKSNSR